MPILSLTSLWRIVVEGHVVSTGGSVRKCYNVFHYQSAGGAVDTPGARGNVASYFNAHIWSSIAALLHQDYVADGIYTWKMTDPTDSLTFAGTNASGSQTGGRLPTNQAVYGYTGSGVRGRWYNGSKRYGPIPTSQVVGDELTAAAHTAWESAHAHCALPMVFFIGHLVWSAVPVVYSRVLSAPAPIPAAQIGAELTTTYCDTTLSQWRHRREKTEL